MTGANTTLSVQHEAMALFAASFSFCAARPCVKTLCTSRLHLGLPAPGCCPVCCTNSANFSWPSGACFVQFFLGCAGSPLCFFCCLGASGPCLGGSRCRGGRGLTPSLRRDRGCFWCTCSVPLPLRWQRRARLWLQKTPQARLASQSVLQGVARLFQRTRVLAPPPLIVRGSRGPPGAKNTPAELGTTDEERGRLPGQIGAFRAIRRFFCVIAPQIRPEIRECVCFFAATWKITRYSSCMACMAHPRSRFILMISTFAFAIAGAVATGTRSAPAGKTLSRAGKVGT